MSPANPAVPLMEVKDSASRFTCVNNFVTSLLTIVVAAPLLVLADSAAAGAALSIAMFLQIVYTFPSKFIKVEKAAHNSLIIVRYSHTVLSFASWFGPDA